VKLLLAEVERIAGVDGVKMQHEICEERRMKEVTRGSKEFVLGGLIGKRDFLQ
jgi:hypothetical protein